MWLRWQIAVNGCLHCKTALVAKFILRNMFNEKMSTAGVMRAIPQRCKLLRTTQMDVWLVWNRVTTVDTYLSQLHGIGWLTESQVDHRASTCGCLQCWQHSHQGISRDCGLVSAIPGISSNYIRDHPLFVDDLWLHVLKLLLFLSTFQNSCWCKWYQILSRIPEMMDREYKESMLSSRVFTLHRESMVFPCFVLFVWIIMNTLVTGWLMENGREGMVWIVASYRSKSWASVIHSWFVCYYRQ